MGIVVALVAVAFAASIFVMGHPTAVIARKTGQSDTAEVLAWIPGLQFIPMIWAAGGTVWQVLLLTAAVLLSAALAGFASSTLGDGPLASAVGGYAAWSADLYFMGFTGWLGWRRADRRALPPAFGLLLTLPLLNVLATWVLAFHDGWAPPHRGGLAAAGALSLALILPGFYLASQVDDEEIQGMLAGMAEAALAEPMAQQRAELRAMEAESALEDGRPMALPMALSEPPSHGATPRPQNDRTIRALFELKGRFERLEDLVDNGATSEDARVSALALVQNLRMDLEGLHDDLDGTTYDELAHHLNRIEASLHTASDRTAGPSGSLALASKRPRASQGGAVPAAPAPLADGPPVRPFPVRVDDACPDGTELRTREGKKGDEEWCQQLTRNGGLRHDWYARYFDSGKPEQVGEYREGLRVGIWTRFHPSGAVRAQAEFRAGLQHGWLLTFSESGERKKAVRFEGGAAVH